MTLDEFLHEWNNDSEQMLVHTSGSTGKPKPMWVEKRRMAASARITCKFLGMKPGDSALLCMPLDFIAGKMVVVRAIVGKLHLINVSPCGHPLSQLNEPPCFAAMVPMQVYNSLQVPHEKSILQGIKQLIIGGGAIDEAMADELRTFPNAVWSTYGMTETLSHIALRRLSGRDASEWYTPFDGVDVSLNSERQLVIDAPQVCASTLVTNDIAELAPDGRHFRIIGRKDNIICSGGIKMQMEEIESALRPYLHAPFLITKVKDEKFGETVVLLTTSHDIETIRQACKEHLTKYQMPRHFITVERIPTTKTGKHARAEAMVLAQENTAK